VRAVAMNQKRDRAPIDPRPEQRPFKQPKLEEPPISHEKAAENARNIKSMLQKIGKKVDE